VRTINVDDISKIIYSDLNIGDYFYDNQVLNLENKLIVAGYVKTWKMIKENSRFIAQTDGLGSRLTKGCQLAMPKSVKKLINYRY
jgi:hypothetical protein